MTGLAVRKRGARILLVAGGTGGHILPAVAFGDWIKKHRHDVAVDYMSGSRALELDIYNKSGVKPFILEMEGSPLGAPKGKKIKRWIGLLNSFSRAKEIIASGEYALCVLFGGYLSAPALSACKMLGVDLLIHEQNARAGIVTRIAATLKVPVASGWEICEPLKEKSFNYTGIPVRCIDGLDRKAAWTELGLPGEFPQGPVAVVTTGSMGSSSVRKSIELLAGMPEYGDWFFIFIDPEAEKPMVSGEGGGHIFRIPRRWDVAPLYSVADILITRGGASTLAEVTALGIPALVIPWRRAAYDHQMLNARQASNLSTIAVWDESCGDIADLSEKIAGLGVSGLPKNVDIGKKMYNTHENVCERLWSLAVVNMKGEIHVEGR